VRGEERSKMLGKVWVANITSMMRVQKRLASSWFAYYVAQLRVFDGKAPAMGMAWRVMHDIQTHIRGFSKPPFRLSLELAANAMLTFQYRWRLMLNDLHWAGAMLNPFLRGWAPLCEDDNSRTILNRVLRRLAPDEDTYVQILHQYQDFLENQGPFVDSTDPNVHAAPLHE
jgi:hypothetical protein